MYTYTKSIPKVDQDSKGQKKGNKAKAVIPVKMFSLKKGEEKKPMNKISFREKLTLHEKRTYLVYEIWIYVYNLIFVLQLCFVINNF